MNEKHRLREAAGKSHSKFSGNKITLRGHKAEQLWWCEKEKGIQIVPGGGHGEKARLSTVVNEHAGKEGKVLFAVRNSLKRCWELGSGGSSYSSQAPGGAADAEDACLPFLPSAIKFDQAY